MDSISVRCGLGAAAVLLASAISAQAAIVIIDDFSDPAGGSKAETTGLMGSTAFVYSSPLSGALGGARDMWVKKTSATNVLTVKIGEGFGTSFFDQGSSTAIGLGLIRWDGTAGSPGQDPVISPGGAFSSPGFALTDLYQGANLFTFSDFSVTTTGGAGPLMTITLNTTSGLLTYSEVLTATTAITKQIAYSAFSGTGVATSVIGVEVFFDGTIPGAAGSDVDFSFVTSEPVPEPASLLVWSILAGVSTIMVAVRKRRRR